MSAPDDAALRAKLTEMTSATATAMLNRRGYANPFMLGARAIQRGPRVCGRAVTVRLGPARPDLTLPDERRNEELLWQAIESLGSGDFLVIDCGGDLRAGTTGDMLATRIKYRGAVGILVDGALRDEAQIRDIVQLPCWSAGVHGSGYPSFLNCLDRDRPVVCFGATVLPGDYILADDDGAVVIPAALAAEIAEAGALQESKETFVRGLIEAGESVSEVYPPNAATLARYEAWKKSGGG